MTEHLSQLALDQVHAGGPVPAHIEACARCRLRLAEQSEEDAAFLRRFPTRAAAGFSSRPSPRRVGQWGWVGAATAALVGLWFTARPAPSPMERTKGVSLVELLIDRDHHPFPFDHRTLRQGDLLVFRLSTQHTRALVLGIEESGRAQALVAAPNGQSMEINPGNGRVLPLGVQLDDHRGKERILILLSDLPIDSSDALRRLEELYRRTPEESRRELRFSDVEEKLGLPVEVRSWAIEKADR
ncbi:MAG: hypothetical protein U1E65_18560 [Myxococcota bacterium]